MLTFLIAAALLTLGVVLLLTRPLWHDHDDAPSASASQLNATLLAESYAELERARANGTLDDSAYRQSRDELDRRLLEETSADDSPTSTEAKRRDLRLPTLAAVALLLPLSAALLYLPFGTPAALDPTAVQTASAQDGGNTPPSAVADMVSKLADKLNKHPDDPTGWAMLGRSYTVLGRYADAVDAFTHIGAALQTNPVWLSEDADAMAMQANGNPVGKPEQLALQALKLDPDNLLSLMLAGYAATERGDCRSAGPLLQRAQTRVSPDSDDANFVRDLRRRCGNAPAAATSATLQVSVSLQGQLPLPGASQALFVIARIPGQPMPIAAVRRSAGELPQRIELGPQDQLDPRHPLAAAKDLEIEARISNSGNAMPVRGDLFGTARLHWNGTSNSAVKVVIDQRR